jgi:PAS domain S-box-containing protein
MKFSEIVNIEELRELCESYTAITGAVTALLELDGDILIATGWQDICTRFHRVNDETACRCRESDTILAGGLKKGVPYNVYKCKNGLVDVAVPIMIRGEHVANFFTGQFFSEPPDRDYFIRQAEEFGFDKDSYLEALQRVPVFSEETVKKMMIFFTRLARLIGEMGLARNELEEGHEKLHKSEERLHLAVKAATIGIFDWDIENNELTWNDCMYSLYGIRKEDFSGAYSAWSTMLHPEDRQQTEAEIKSALHGEREYTHEFRITRPDGTVRFIKAASQTYFDDNGKPLRMIGTNIDITDRKKAEEEKRVFEQQIQQTQKLESLGVLAGGIAHDFNNILAVIIGNCSLAEMNYETARNYIPVIEKAAERAAGLCRQMMAYAGKAPSAPTLVIMWLLVDDVVNMLKTTIRQNVTIKTSYLPDIPTITGDASQLRQIVMNLIINAAEAIGDVQGEVCVSLSKSEIRAGQSVKDHLGTVIPDGRYLCLEITDNGCGMDEETKRRIFEPFYTTKFPGRGLGMSAVLGILKAHNGALQISSQPGEGAAFKVYLPVSKGVATEEESLRQTAPALWQGNGTILLVEDEVEVMSTASAMMKEMGFTVIEAVNGKEALEMYQQGAADITLVLTDIGMPVMGGYELFRELKTIAPKLPIIISSGFGDMDIKSNLPVEEIAGLVSKPYNFYRLREVLQGVVETFP